MKEDKIIRVVFNEKLGVKGLICQVYNEVVVNDSPKANALSWKQFGYNFYDISDWKALEDFAEKYKYTFTEEAREFIREYCKKYSVYDKFMWNYNDKEISFETFCQLIEDKSGIWKREIKDYLANDVEALSDELVLDALCDGLKIIKEETGLDKSKWSNSTKDFFKEKFAELLLKI